MSSAVESTICTSSSPHLHLAAGAFAFDLDFTPDRCGPTFRADITGKSLVVAVLAAECDLRGFIRVGREGRVCGVVGGRWDRVAIEMSGEFDTAAPSSFSSSMLAFPATRK